MKLVGTATLADFMQRHTDVRGAVEAWVAEVERAGWGKPQDIRQRYPRARFLPDNTVIFNLKGNSYRLEVVVTYQHQTVMVRRIGTHAEYDRWT